MDSSSGRGASPAELAGLEPVDGVALIQDDLRLPHQDDAHNTQGDETDSEDHAFLRFRRRTFEVAPKPRHSEESPSTQSAIYVNLRTEKRML